MSEQQSDKLDRTTILHCADIVQNLVRLGEAGEIEETLRRLAITVPELQLLSGATPRTDKLVFSVGSSTPLEDAYQRWWEMRDHARQLERELAEAKDVQIHQVEGPQGKPVAAPCQISGCQYEAVARSASGFMSKTEYDRIAAGFGASYAGAYDVMSEAQETLDAVFARSATQERK